MVTSGVSAKERPGAVEEFLAGRVRNMAIARRAKSLTNPVPYSDEVVAEGLARLRLLTNLSPQWRHGAELQGQFCLQDGHLLSLVSV